MLCDSHASGGGLIRLPAARYLSDIFLPPLSIVILQQNCYNLANKHQKCPPLGWQWQRQNVPRYKQTWKNNKDNDWADVIQPRERSLLLLEDLHLLTRAFTRARHQQRQSQKHSIG
jgi:hypothetical protein